MDFSILKKKNSQLLLSGQVISVSGSLMQNFALSLYVLFTTESAVMYASVLAASIIPRLIIGPFAGVLIDRVSRKKLLVFIDMINGIAVLGFAVLFFLNQGFTLWMVYTLAIFLSVTSAIFDPTLQAILPDIVSKEKLADINSMVQFIFATLSILAPLAAAQLYTSSGMLVMLLINGISFVLCSVIELFIKIKAESIRSPEHKVSFFKDFSDGFHYLWRTPVLLLMLFIVVIGNFALYPVVTVAVPYILKNDLLASEHALSLFYSLIMAGPIIGSLIAPRLMRRVHYTTIVTTVLVISTVAVAAACLFFTPGTFGEGYAVNLAALIGLFIIIAMGVIIATLAMNTARLQIVPGELLGRVLAVTTTLSMAASPLGQMIMGSMLEGMSSVSVVMVFAGLTLISAGFSFAGFKTMRKRGKIDMNLY